VNLGVTNKEYKILHYVYGKTYPSMVNKFPMNYKFIGWSLYASGYSNQ